MKVLLMADNAQKKEIGADVTHSLDVVLQDA